MYIRVGNEKILVKHCIFGVKNDCVEVNGRFLIDNECCFDSKEVQDHKIVNIHGVDYDCKKEFEKILKMLRDM